MIYDVLVLGGGIIGASTAYALSRQGKNVLLIDRHAPGHEHGSSHGDGRIVRFNYTEEIYVKMAQLGFPVWERLSQAAGQPLMQKTGIIEYGPADSMPIQLSENQLAALDIPYQNLSTEAAREQFPQFDFADGTRTLYQASGGVAFATPTVNALWRLIDDTDSTTRTHTPIVQIDATDSQVMLHAEDGSLYTGRKLVLAAGSWMKPLCALLDVSLPLTVTQEVLCYYPPAETTDVNHQIGVMPTLVDYHDETVPFYCLPQVEIPGVKAGWHHSGVEIDPSEPRPPASEAIIEHLNGWIERLFPHLVPEPIEVLTCLYTSTPDHHFILNTHPTLPNVVLAAGFSGHGFKFGPVIGELLADLLLDNEPALSLETFQLARFTDNRDLSPHVGA